MGTHATAMRTGRAMIRFAAWRRKHVSDSLTLIVVAAITGICAGFGAFLLKFFIGHLADFFVTRVNPYGVNYLLLAVPVAGILLTACYQLYWIRTNLMHGASRLVDDLAHRRYYLPAHLTYAPIVASTITLGFGGSAGGEGPIACSGAAIGSNLGRILGLRPDVVRILIGCGAGAGIAGIFKSPVGGVLFTLEVLKMRMTTLSVLALVVAGICGFLTCYMCTGFTPDINFINTTPFDPSLLGWMAGLGVLCGLYSIYYSKVMHHMQAFFTSIRNHWVMNITGGAILGACVFTFPILFGEGYDVLTRVCNGDFGGLLKGSPFEQYASGAGGWVLVLLMAVVLLLKCWACVASNSAGGVAGDFAPTIFAGAMVGFVYASAVNMIFGTSLPVGIFALLGTAGAFSGIIHAPLMAIFLTAEMSDGYGFFLGLAVTATVSYTVVKLLRPHSIYAKYRHDDLSALLKKK